MNAATQTWLDGDPGYPGLNLLLSEMTDQVAAALKAKDDRALARFRLDRAYIELKLRDLFGPWSNQGARWQACALDDVTQARKAFARATGTGDLLAGS